MNGGRFCTTRIWRPPSLTVSWNEARFIRLDGPSGRTRHLKLEEKLEEPLPGATERFRISGKNGSEFPEPTSGVPRSLSRCDPHQGCPGLSVFQSLHIWPGCNGFPLAMI